MGKSWSCTVMGEATFKLYLRIFERAVVGSA